MSRALAHLLLICPPAAEGFHFNKGGTRQFQQRKAPISTGVKGLNFNPRVEIEAFNTCGNWGLPLLKLTCSPLVEMEAFSCWRTYQQKMCKSSRHNSLHILLNLKAVAVKVHSPGLKKMYIKSTGPGEIRAGNFETDSELSLIHI